MAKLLASVSTVGLCVCLGFGAPGCGRTSETKKTNPDRQTMDGKKPEITLHARTW
jgi:hypothetical protein